MNSKRHYFDELAPRWDSMPARPRAAEKITFFCRRACRRNPKLVLDVGAGTGLLVPALLVALPPEAAVIELDYAIQMLRIGGAKAPDKRILPVCADATAPPFSPSAFPAVLCFGILPHLGETRAALENLWALVSPGGSLAVGHFLSSVALNQLHAEIGGTVKEDHLPPAHQVAGMLNAMGARPVEAEDGPEGYFVFAEKNHP